MKENSTEIGVGIDVGSSSVRVGIYRVIDDTIIAIQTEPVPYYYDDDPQYLWNYTQKSEEIMNAIYVCFQKLSISNYQIKSCGVSATCSMAVFKRSKDGLEPISFSSETTKNVVFWMDSSALKSCRELNNRCPLSIKYFMGGEFIPEMGIPKLSRLIEHIASINECCNEEFEVFDLHRYIAFKLATEYHWNFEKIINTPNSNGIGNDGELSGWSISFYSTILNLPPNISIGPISNNNRQISDGNKNVKVDSCIDCYSSWFALCSPDLHNSLFLVGGTSSCYLFASSTTASPIPGVWGPFTDIFGNNSISVYECGQSCTGNLLEHLFRSHPISCHLTQTEWPNLYDKIENEIKIIEIERKHSIHLVTKYMFLYGDLQGNRTPYADPHMTGMFIGETTDVSFRSLVFKYICVLEFLAFQIKLIIQLFNRNCNNASINELRICGSQAKNHRLLSLIANIVEDVSIIMPTENIAYTGVSGAYQLGKATYHDISIYEFLRKTKKQVTKFQTTHSLDAKVIKLLDTKFEIHLEMAEQQIKYRTAVDEVIK